MTIAEFQAKRKILYIAHWKIYIKVQQKLIKTHKKLVINLEFTSGTEFRAKKIIKLATMNILMSQELVLFLELTY